MPDFYDLSDLNQFKNSAPSVPALEGTFDPVEYFGEAVSEEDAAPAEDLLFI